MANAGGGSVGLRSRADGPQLKPRVPLAGPQNCSINLGSLVSKPTLEKGPGPKPILTADYAENRQVIHRTLTIWPIALAL